MRRSEAAQNGRNFAVQKGLAMKVDLFEKAARVLQDPAGYNSLQCLSQDEKNALASETRSNRHIWRNLQRNFFKPSGWATFWQDLFPPNGFWRQPKQLRSTTIMLCVAAVVQGWCQASSNGANLNWAFELLGPSKGLESNSNCDPTGHQAWIFATVNAAPYLAASLVGCWLSDPLSEGLLGRRAPLAVSAVSVVASAIGSAFVQKPDWGLLLLCRVILGIGMGTKAAIVPVFAAEIAPAHLRGSLVMNWQLFDAFGIFAGFTANLIAARAGADAWRWQFASAALPAIILLGQIYAAPESPRYLMKQAQQGKQGKYAAAYETFLALRGEPILAAKELLYAHEQMLKELKLLSLDPPVRDTEAQNTDQVIARPAGISFFRKLKIIFVKKRTRRALLAAVVVMLAQQLCGINVLMFYSSTVYGDLGKACGQANVAHPARHLRPLFLSWGIGLANWLFAFPAYWLIVRRGRRFLLLTTLPLMALSILAAGLSYQLSKDNPAYVPVIALFTYIFVALYSVGMGPVPFTYSAECFPIEVRMVGMSFAVFTNLLGAGLLALFVPVVTWAINHFPLLGIFAGLNIVALVLVFLFVPETAGAAVAADPTNAVGSLTAMSLEELNYVFGVETRKHMHYQLQEVLRDYFLPKYIMMRSDVSRPIKFYKWPQRRRQSRSDTLTTVNTQRENTSSQPNESTTSNEPNGTTPPNYLSPSGPDGATARDQPAANVTTNVQEVHPTPNRPPQGTTSDDNTLRNRNNTTTNSNTAIDQGAQDDTILPSESIYWQMLERMEANMQFLTSRVATLEAEGHRGREATDIPLNDLNEAGRHQQ